MPNYSYDSRHEEIEMPTVEELEKKYPEKLPSLVGVNGNAFAILGHFETHARRAGWDRSDIDAVKKHAKSGDYNNLLNIVMKFTD